MSSLLIHQIRSECKKSMFQVLARDGENITEAFEKNLKNRNLRKNFDWRTV